MTTTTEDLTVVTLRAVEMADELVKLAQTRITDSKEEVEAIITGLNDRLENDRLTAGERALIELTLTSLEERVDTLWRMTRP